MGAIADQEDSYEDYTSADSDDENHLLSDEDEEYETESSAEDEDEPSVENSLERSMVRLIHHTISRDLVIEESPTLRLVKALHETNLENVILAIEKGARTNFQVCLLLKISV